MAIINANTYQVSPGRMDDFLAYMAEGVQHIARHGGEARLLRAAIAGPRTNTVIMAIRGAEDMIQFGQMWEAYAADPDAQQLMQRWAADRPTDSAGDFALYADMLEPIGSGERGKLVHMVLTQVRPGHLDAYRELAMRWQQAMLDFGAMNVWVQQGVITGSASGNVVGAAEYRDWNALGDAFTRRNQDTEYQRQVLGPASAVDSPAIGLGQSIWVDITPS